MLRTRLTVLAALVTVAGGLQVAGGTTALADTGPALAVDPAAERRPISEYIYGMNFADEALARELRLPVRRWGGNATTRYHFRYDTTNRASDWFFENIPGEQADPSKLPDGSETDRFVEQDRRTGTDTILTVPLIGWAPKSRDYACGFSVAKYGPQEKTDPWRPDCGNGVRPDGTRITGNDPHDTSVEIGPEYIHDWLDHLTGKYGTAGQGGVRFYNLDNEPDLWHETHRDVHPQGAGYDEMRDRTYEIAAAVKAADPSAKTLGPVGWGYLSLNISGLDQETCSREGCWANPPDRAAHGGVPFAAWYLRQMRAYEEQHGVRILDYFDNHIYPQQAGVALGGAGDAATQALRLRSTRQLWDPTYVDESWINDTVMFIPRMRQLVEENYPGTKLAITEYNWGALDHINGALAQADVLGIFGREGLDMATLWAPPAADQPGAFAFRMYRNYDGEGGAFGDVHVRATSADQDKLAVYAAQRTSDGALTVIVINKTLTDLTSQVSIAGLTGSRTAQVYRYGQADTTRIVREADQPVSGGGFTATFPAYSITHVVIPAGSGEDTQPPTTPGKPVASDVTSSGVTLSWPPATDDTGVARYEVYSGAELVGTVPGDTTTFTVTGLQPQTSYTFTVRAVDAAGNRSEPSEPVTVTTAPEGGGSLAARYRNNDWSVNDNQIKPGLQVVNTGAAPVSLSRVTLRYWFTRDGGSSTFATWCDYAAIGCAKTTRKVVLLPAPRYGADAYLEVGFTAAAGDLAPGKATGEIQNRLNKTDWSNFTESDDHSWAGPAGSYADNPKVTVYLDGRLVAGIEPR